MYPASALIGNWMVLNAVISPLQAIGCAMLLATVFVLAWYPGRAVTPHPAPLAVEGSSGLDDR